MNITKGVEHTPPKVLIYGMSGVGKTTMASTFTKPLVFDMEHSAKRIDVDKVRVDSLNQFYKDMNELRKVEDKDGVKVIKGKSELGKNYENIVIDTLDWLDGKIKDRIFGLDKPVVTKEDMKARADGLKLTLNRANGGYGNGKGELENNVRAELLPRLGSLEKLGYGIVATAHAQKSKMMTSEGYEVETIMPKISDVTMNLFMEWFDCVFYLKLTDSGERILQVQSHDGILAKNRYGLTEDIVVDDDFDINKLFEEK